MITSKARSDGLWPRPRQLNLERTHEMKFHFLTMALALALFTPALPAQEAINPSGQWLQGTWIAQLTDAAGNTALFEVGTFAPDGSYSGANVNPTHTEHKGIWVRIGDRKFLLNIMFFTRDEKGVFNGIVKAKIYITMSEDLQTYESLAERTVMDTSGKVLSVTPGIVGKSVRMKLEMPAAPPPQ